MAANKLTLETNVPLTGMLKTVRWFENEHGKALIIGLEVPSDNQGVLMGMYEAGPGTFFVNDEAQAMVLQTLGIAMPTAKQQKHGPAWQVVGAPLIQFLKTEDGKNRIVTITRLDGVQPSVQIPPPVAQAPAQATNQPEQAPMGAPPETRADRGKGNGNRKSPEQLKEEAVRDWKRLATCYHKALEIAATGLHKALVDTIDPNTGAQPALEQRAVATVANSIMIAADRNGLQARTLAGMFKKPANPEQGIGPGEGVSEEDDDLPF